MTNKTIRGRMKDDYEVRAQSELTRRTYTLIRIDGKAFHSYTEGADKPFDKNLMSWMDNTAIGLCEEIPGAKFAYVQSDEISILLTDFDNQDTQAWFDGNVQKLTSVSASIATREFIKQDLMACFRDAVEKKNKESIYTDVLALMADCLRPLRSAAFDSRVWTIPYHIEVENYFISRQVDCMKNSIMMSARAVYTHAECDHKNGLELKELLKEKGIDWDNYTTGEKHGRIIMKETYEFHSKKSSTPVQRSHWVAYDGSTKKLETPIFTENRDFLKALVPTRG